MHEIGIEWMTQTEVNGHFLELRGIPDEKLKWERIPEAIAGANYYNIQNIPGQLTVEPDSGKIYLKICLPQNSRSFRPPAAAIDFL